jgi:hypothetical protein
VSLRETGYSDGRQIKLTVSSDRLLGLQIRILESINEALFSQDNAKNVLAQ